MPGSSSIRFGSLAVLFHWTVFLGVLALFALGLYMTELDYYHPWYNSAPAVHKAAGMLLLGLVLLRGAWRLFDRPPRRLIAIRLLNAGPPGQCTGPCMSCWS